MSSVSPPAAGTTAVGSRKAATTVTPTDEDEDETLAKRMSVEKGIVEELLLVCGVIGSADDQNQFIPVTDCLNWLQDLQRALRRDDDAFRPISLLMGNWKVVQQKLLPLVVSCRYDNPMVLTVVKILVILTKPLSEAAKRAGRMVIDTKSRKVPDSVIKEQIKLRDNALQQSEMLMEYKRAVTHHSSHMATSNNNNKSSEEEGGLLSVFVSLLAEPLSKTGTARTDTDHLTIELVLHLFRNLLSAEPILKSSTEASQRSAQLHQEIISLFERELVLDIFLVIAQDMESRENAQYNLLMMELLNHLLRNQDPTLVARSVHRSSETKQKKENEHPTGAQSASAPKSGSLLAQLHREKKKLRPPTTTRHSHFGGTLVVNRADGKRQYVSATALVQGATASSGMQARKRKNRRTDPFIGSGRTMASHSHQQAADDTPAAWRAQRTLDTFCSRFLKDCYGPLMKSLKNEFRRDSVRLEEGDKVVFFRMVWFFCQWWRVAGRRNSDQETALGQLIFTMDVFTFNLVLNSTDTFFQHKKYSQLAQSVALYSEMTQLLHIMYRSKDSTEHIMALGLLDRLFYSSDPLDRLPKLLSRWQPGTFTREYLCDLVELCHISLKLLETNASLETDAGASEKKKKNDAVARMKQAAADFDLPSYVLRKIVSNQTVYMYTHLLSQFLVNAPHINHHILALFLRLSRFQVAVSDDDDDSDERYDDAAALPKNELALRTTTLEPMLYNIQLFLVLNQILNDASVQKDKEYASLISFAASLMRRFASHAQENPMLHVECLFRHPVPHRYCELSTNLYVNDELRLFAERAQLLEEQRRLEESEERDLRTDRQEQQQQQEDDDEGEFEEEHQFGEDPDTASNKEKEDREHSSVVGDAQKSSEPSESPSPDADKDKDDDDSNDGDDKDDESPKRKNDDINEASPTLAEPPVSKKQRFSKMMRDDSSDEEDEFEFDAAASAKPAEGSESTTKQSSSRRVLEDDDEDE